jgi:hypothetical protein
MNLVITARNGNFANTKVAQSDGTVAGTSAPVTMDAQYTDVRPVGLNTNSSQCIALTNRGGPPGSPGAGTNWVLPADISQVGNLSSTSAYRQPGLDAHIVNPHAAVTYGNHQFILDSDQHAIYAISVTGSTFSVYDDGFVFQHVILDAAVTLGSSLEVVNGKMYAAFYGYTQNGTVYNHQPGELVRLKLINSGPELEIDTSGGIGETGIRQLGLNPTGMAHAQDARDSDNIVDYLLITCVGGMQQGGQGNGAASVLKVVNLNTYTVLATDPLNGTAMAPSGSVTLDLHSVSATLPSTLDVSETNPIAKGDCYVHIMAATYSDSDFYFTDYKVCETKLSTLLGFSSAEQTKNLNDLRQLDYNIDIFGFFWATIFAPTAATGLPGQLIVGRGSDSGDYLDIYPVTQNGAGTRVPISSDNFYGPNQFGMINAAALVLFDFGGEQQAFKIKITRSFTPPPVASGQVSMADFVAAREKKIKK